MNNMYSFCLDAKRIKKIKAVCKSRDFVWNLQRCKTKLAPPASGLKYGFAKNLLRFHKIGICIRLGKGLWIKAVQKNIPNFECFQNSG